MIREALFTRPRLVDQFHSMPARTVDALLCGAVGRWSNCDAYILCPDSWGSVNAATLRLTAIHDAARLVLVTSDLWLTPFTQHGGGWRTYRIASVRGAVADGFELLGSSPGGASLPGAYFYLRCWGTESTPEAMGQSIQQAMSLRGAEQVMPHRLAHMSYFDSASQVHRLATGDASGRIYTVPIPENLADGGQGYSDSRQAYRVAVPFGCRLRWVQMTNTGAALRWFQVYDRSTEPPVGTKCEFSIPAAATSGRVELNLSASDGWKTYNGLVFACSSDPDTYQPQADGWFAWIAKQ